MHERSTTADAEARRTELLRLAERQGVKPIENIDDLRADFWTEDAAENGEDFLSWLRTTRDEKGVAHKRT